MQLTDETVARVAKAMFDVLIAGDGPYTLAQGGGPENVTLDGSFDLRDLAMAAIMEINPASPLTDQRSHTPPPQAPAARPRS